MAEDPNFTIDTDAIAQSGLPLILAAALVRLGLAGLTSLELTFADISTLQQRGLKVRTTETGFTLSIETSREALDRLAADRDGYVVHDSRDAGPPEIKH